MAGLLRALLMTAALLPRNVTIVTSRTVMFTVWQSMLHGCGAVITRFKWIRFHSKD